MYKVGDEVYVKARVVDTDESTFEDYRHKVQFSDSINNEWDWVAESSISGGTYEQGLVDAWELAKKITLAPDDGGIATNDIEAIFGKGTYCTMRDFTAAEALAKIEAYEKEKEMEIKVNDEVIVCTVSGSEFVAVVTCKYDNEADVMYKGGNVAKHVPIRLLKKTGKHIDIESLLRQIGE